MKNITKYLSNPYFLLTLLFCVYGMRNIILHSGNVFDDYDGLLILWIIKSHILKFPIELGSFFQGNIFFPYKDTLAFTSPFVVSSVISFFPSKYFSNPAQILSFLEVFWQFSTVLILCIFIKDLTKSSYSSLVGSILYGFSNYRISTLGHLQMFNMSLCILAIYLVWKYTQSKKQIFLIYAAIISGLQAWENFIQLYFIFLSVFFILVTKVNLKRHFKNFFKPIIVFLVVSLGILIKYFIVSKEYGIVRSIREAAHFSISIDYLWKNYFERLIYIGLLISSILIFKKKISIKKEKWIYIVITLSLIFCFGPVLKYNDATVKIFGKYFIPLPYGIFYYIIPGFNSLRTPSRWFSLSLLMASLIISFTTKYLDKIKFSFLLKCFIIIAVLFFIYIPKNNIKLNLQNPPYVYGWLKSQSGLSIIEMPLYTWGAGDISKNEVYRMVYSLDHGKKIVNGYSGFYPKDWENFAHDLWNNFPDSKTAQEIKQTGVNYLILHKDEYGKDKLLRIEKFYSGDVIYEDPASVVYKIN